MQTHSESVMFTIHIHYCKQEMKRDVHIQRCQSALAEPSLSRWDQVAGETFFSSGVKPCLLWATQVSRAERRHRYDHRWSPHGGSASLAPFVWHAGACARWKCAWTCYKSLRGAAPSRQPSPADAGVTAGWVPKMALPAFPTQCLPSNCEPHGKSPAIHINKEDILTTLWPAKQPDGPISEEECAKICCVGEIQPR